MIDVELLLWVGAGLAVVLFLILVLRIPAFISLLVASLVVGLGAGLTSEEMISTIQRGMGGTLGYVAVVVGLGAIFGGILEACGGAETIARHLLSLFGEKRAGFALSLTGFIIAIPVFFDVAFIILIPLIYSLQRKTGRSLLTYAIPLLAGLAITHAFIPPTPGPVAVADIIDAPLGLVILCGFIVGLPTLILCGPMFGRWIGERIHIIAPPEVPKQDTRQTTSPLAKLLLIIAVPILLILAAALFNETKLFSSLEDHALGKCVVLFGHPFVALIIANLLAWYFLGRIEGLSSKRLLEISNNSLEPAGIIILLTGAGGVLKQVLVDTKAGEMLAKAFLEMGFSIFLFAWCAAVAMRLLQGSATVAMITAASLSAAILPASMEAWHRALLVIVIASGASIFSHVNDSGFWLVGKYLGLDLKQTVKSWSMMTLGIAVFGLLFSGLLLVLI